MQLMPRTVIITQDQDYYTHRVVHSNAACGTQDTWRAVPIDDRIPVDLFGRPLLVGVLPLALWPLLLSKAVLKVMAALRVTDMSLPHQVCAHQMLTGWPQEDLIDPLAGVQLSGGLAWGSWAVVVGGDMWLVRMVKLANGGVDIHHPSQACTLALVSVRTWYWHTTLSACSWVLGTAVVPT
jgi:hypothetical protein